jgi:O-antigen/teichoic acid export membrane protein
MTTELQTPRAHGSRVIADAMSLFGTTVVTSGAGFAFWWAAAHLFDRSAIGSASAAISAMQLLGIAGMLGLGTLLIGELSKRGPGGDSMLSTALIVSAVCGAGLGAIFVVVIDAASPAAHEVPGGVGGAAVFVATVATTAALLVFDDATVGLGRASWQLWRNIAFSLIKLGLLPVIAALLGLGGSAALLGAWLAGALISAAMLGVFTRREGRRGRMLGRPRTGLVRVYGRSALTHHWLNISSGAPRLLLPVLVAAFLSPVVNSGFYAALLLVGFAYVLPSQLATACFAIASGDHEALAHVLRRALRITVVVGLGTALAFALLGRFLLSIFGDGYESTATVLTILGTATIATGIKSIYISVCRVNGDLGRCAVVSCVGSAFEVGLPLLALALHGGLVAVAGWWVVAMWVEAVLLWPAVAAASGLSGGIPGRLIGLVRWSAPRTLALGPGGAR